MTRFAGWGVQADRSSGWRRSSFTPPSFVAGGAGFPQKFWTIGSSSFSFHEHEVLKNLAFRQLGDDAEYGMVLGRGRFGWGEGLFVWRGGGS